MKRIVYLFTIVAMTMALTCSCAGCGNEKEEDDVLSFEQAKEHVPSLMSTDEIVALVKSDTTHKKVVYWFDLLCKPCRVHLENEIATFYVNHDTAEWKIYLVAGLNGLHYAVPSDEGALEEDPAESIVHFAEEYRKLLPTLGFDMKDVYMHYDPVLDRRDEYMEKYPEGFFTQIANEMFYSDKAFHYGNDGVPKLIKADRDNQVQAGYYILINKNNDTLDKSFEPNDEYLFDIEDFARHDTAVGIMMSER